MEPQGFLKLEMDRFLIHASRENVFGKLASKFLHTADCMMSMIWQSLCG
jgi:hypothetical protein